MTSQLYPGSCVSMTVPEHKGSVQKNLLLEKKEEM